MMNKDILYLTSLYEQILLTEDSELSRLGFSREFINSLFTKYNIPHDAKFTKLTKIPSLNDMNDYGVVIARLKGKEGGIIIVHDSLYDFDGKEIGRYSSNSYTFVTVKSAVDKNSIYGMVKNGHIENRKELKNKEFLPLGDDIFNILQTKFGKKFREKIKNLQDYIYTNIRTFEHKRVVRRGRNLGADILEVMDVLIKLTEIDKFSGTNFIRDKDEGWRSEYHKVMRNTINKFLEPYGGPRTYYTHELAQTYRDFVKQFNEHPSYVQLAKRFMQSLDAYEDEVLYYIHSDYFKNIPPEQHEIKLKELKDKEITDTAYKDMELADLYDF
jgi:hypothetical protein